MIKSVNETLGIKIIFTILEKYYYKLQFICNTPSFLERTEGFRRIQNGQKGFQKLFSLPFSVAFVELLLCFCSKREVLLRSKKPFGPFWMCQKTFQLFPN
jgi:hypothetical protein